MEDRRLTYGRKRKIASERKKTKQDELEHAKLLLSSSGNLSSSAHNGIMHDEENIFNTW